MSVTRVCAFWDQGQAAAAGSFLASCGLHPLHIATAPHVLVAGADQWIYVEVPTEEAEEARQLLADAGFQANILE